MTKWHVTCWEGSPFNSNVDSYIGVHTFKIIRYGTVPVFFIRLQYSNGTDTGYFLYFVDVVAHVSAWKSVVGLD